MRDTTEYKYLIQFYSEEQIIKYTNNCQLKLIELYNLTQPVTVPIASLMTAVHENQYLVDSPDGWVPVTDCVEKIKPQVYEVETSSTAIIASHDHLFQLADNSWIYTHELQAGDIILGNPDSTVLSSKLLDADQTRVYDLTIDHANHRYYTDGLCSHNTGKSVMLANLAVNYALQKMNVLYVTLELSEELVCMRLDSLVTDIATHQIFKERESVNQIVRTKRFDMGHLQVKFLPSGKTVNDIRGYMKEYEIKNNRNIDVLVIDYLDLLMPTTVKISPENLFIKDKYVSEELRNLAAEKNVVLLTASQLNRCLTLDTIVVEKTRGPIPISEVQVGDKLISNKRFNVVTNVYPVTNQLVYAITTQNNCTIKASAKHLFPTQRGLMSIETGLTTGDLLYVKNNGQQPIISITELTVEPTIDISLTGNRVFFANEILTHNSGVEETEFNHSHISGGLSKIQTADNVFAIFTNKQMRDRGQYQLQLMKTRNSSGVGSKIDLAFDTDTLRISDYEDYNQGPSTSTLAQTLLRNNKQKAELAEYGATTMDVQIDPNELPFDPDNIDLATTKKIKAEFDTASVRNIIMNGFDLDD